MTPDNGRSVKELTRLANYINPKIDILPAGRADFTVAIGENPQPIDSQHTLYAGCNGWEGYVGTKHPYAISDKENPFGAAFAACLASANQFRCLFLEDGKQLLDHDISFPGDASTFPDLVEKTIDNPMVLAGVGAIGNSVAWSLSRTPFIGTLLLVDPEKVELSNLQRYSLCIRKDEGKDKVVVARKFFRSGLKALSHKARWDYFVEEKGYKWDRVIVALDTVRDRRAVQASLPRWIANAWTQIDDMGSSTHTFIGDDACLACLYQPTETGKNEDQLVAEGLGVPERQNEVRALLDRGNPVSLDFCNAVANGLGVSQDKTRPYVGKSIRDLWVRGICGGGIIPMGDAGPAQQDVQVPLAFQSAMAGVLSAMETSLDILNNGQNRTTRLRRLNIMRPLSNSSPVLRRKDGNNRCICQDKDYINVYNSVYGTA